ncbi:MAG: TIGR00268 family protein [Desulfuromonas sp.]|nr:MAG: TIGR00268 family protein [Desulfuromonas sp.]
MSLDEKYRCLQQLLARFDSVAVAFSGGVDSTLLVKVAGDTLPPGKVLALTARSPIFPTREIADSSTLAAALGIPQQFVTTNQLELPAFVANDPMRCYHCKLHLLALLEETARAAGYTTLVDGSNQDDLSDYRPGQTALEELKIRSPLLEAGFTKADVRELSRHLGLPNWDKPALPCLATRIPYGEHIEETLLQRIERCEDWLTTHEITGCRVRCHGNLARLEVAPELMPRLLEEPLRNTLLSFFRENGFDYITLDLQGYRCGSMNEPLSERQ